MRSCAHGRKRLQTRNKNRSAYQKNAEKALAFQHFFVNILVEFPESAMPMVAMAITNVNLAAPIAKAVFMAAAAIKDTTMAVAP